MNGLLKKVLLSIVILGLSVMVMKISNAAQNNVPTGSDTFTTFNSSRFSNPNLNGTTVSAEAGNVTGLNLHENTATQAWAGYYGNVSGTIVLSDSASNTMYNWQLTSPSGQIFASNGSMVSWSLTTCVNLTANGSSDYPMNYTMLENFFVINKTDMDGFNETFNDTYNDISGFTVGSVRINTVDKCPMAYTFVDSAYQQTDFKEVLLTDNSSIIFTALINDSKTGFKSSETDPVDFQMLIAENGHVGSESTLTTYYFFIQLT